MEYQNQRLIAYLRTHPEGLSVAEAPAAIGVGCLTKRVSECRREGYDIRAYKLEKPSPWGGVVRFNKYYIGDDKDCLTE